MKCSLPFFFSVQRSIHSRYAQQTKSIDTINYQAWLAPYAVMLLCSLTTKARKTRELQAEIIKMKSLLISSEHILPVQLAMGWYMTDSLVKDWSLYSSHSVMLLNRWVFSSALLTRENHSLQKHRTHFSKIDRIKVLFCISPLKMEIISISYKPLMVINTPDARQ